MNELGIDPVLLIAQAINFAIIIFVLNKILYKPILSILEKRKQEISQGVLLAEKMRIEEEKLSSKQAKLLDTARKEGQAIITEAKKKAKVEADEIVNTAQSEATALLEKGKTELGLQKKSMEKEMRSFAVSLALTMAKRLLSASIGEKESEKILDKHVAELNSIQSTVS